MTDVQTSNPLSLPYRTGSYLISDEGPGHFRVATNFNSHPYRASGSHQLSLAEYVGFFSDFVVSPHKPQTIFLVDLREETHGFFDGAPVSWYADNDFANVGQSKEWILADEMARVLVYEGGRTQLFTIKDDPSDDLEQQRVLPTGFTEIRVSSARTEADLANILSEVLKPTRVMYVRVPVTDHCAPGDRALADLRSLSGGGEGNWFHFHCHGGDGRTTTFLALYDMLCWKRSGDPLPSLEDFATRQVQLSQYSLDPSGTVGWKRPLADARWEKLGEFLASL